MKNSSTISWTWGRRAWFGRLTAETPDVANLLLLFTIFVRRKRSSVILACFCYCHFILKHPPTIKCTSTSAHFKNISRSSEQLFSSVYWVGWLYFTPECPCAHLTSRLWLDRMSLASIDFNHKQAPPASQPQVAPCGTQLARVVRVLGHIGPKSSPTIWGKVHCDPPVNFLLNIAAPGVLGDLLTFALVLGVKNQPATHKSRLGLHRWN